MAGSEPTVRVLFLQKLPVRSFVSAVTMGIDAFGEAVEGAYFDDFLKQSYDAE